MKGGRKAQKKEGMQEQKHYWKGMEGKEACQEMNVQYRGKCQDENVKCYTDDKCKNELATFTGKIKREEFKCSIFRSS